MTRAGGVFVASIFSSAFLLFLVQPLVTRMLLPTYGGSPAVWNTALVFFQTALLGGYLYAHLLTTRVPARLRVPLHVLVLALPLVTLPPTMSADLVADGGGAWPAATLLQGLLLMVGAPFFALSSNSSLVQHWWSTSGLRRGDDPYWLYGASNVGSLLALLAYPFVVEPLLGVGVQSRAWSWGYVVFVAVTLVAMRRGAHGAASAIPAPPENGTAALSAGARRPVPGNALRDGAGSTTDVTAGRKLMWVVRAAVGSSLLLSVTMQITTDLAPVPLLWVVPLALYLVTFIVAFGASDRVSRRFTSSGTVIALSAAVATLLIAGRLPFELLLTVSLSTLFFGALLCHHDLAADRPAARDLTSFYLWISVGGAAGGILNSLVAPVVFDSVAELPLTLMAVATLVYLEPGAGRPTAYRPAWTTGVLAAGALLVPLVVALEASTVAGFQRGVMALLIGLVWVVALVRYVGLFGLAVWIACTLTLTGVASRPFTVEQARSFFGVVQVQHRSNGIDMVHGTTVHGRQLVDPEHRLMPVSYYYPEGPLGSLVAQAGEDARVGLVGLGTGSLAVLAPPGADVVYYEIDPLVERLARDHFTFLDEARANVRVELGDGRLELADEPERSFDLLLIDAFSSDFVPVHLLTVEAVDLYLSRVRPGGLVAFHVSNRHVDLRRVLRGYAETRGLDVLYADYSPTPEADEIGAVRTVAAVLAPDPQVLSGLASTDLWSRFAMGVPAVVWTDDHADLWSVLR